MKKHYVTLVITLILAATLSFVGCGEKSGGSGTLTSGGVNLMEMLPMESTAIFAVNFSKFAGLDVFDKMIKESEAKQEEHEGPFKNYQDFVDKTGINPKTDIYGMAVALTSPLIAQDKEPDFLVVVNIKINKDTVLKLAKEKGVEFAEEAYNGAAFFKFTDDKGKEMAFSFIKENVVAAGPPANVQKAIDLAAGKGQSILANAKMKAYLDKFKGDVLASFVMDFPEEGKKAQDNGMFKYDLTKAEAIVGHIDYSGNTFAFEMALISKNPEANKQLVNTLNGLKVMGASAGPEVGELVENLTLTANDDSIVMNLKISEQLMEKLKTKMSKKSEDKAEEATEPTEETPAEAPEENSEESSEG